ncbi:MAG TPA: RrF2 family transcriptional regulator [Gemmatimonadales bacterium]|jgi:Rrf2 family protein|nr:RrF2 family transcriptional regulator [Gemmatimonadales bacterium]
MLSQTAEYALRAVLYLADHPADRAAPVDQLAARLGVPRNYLSKTLHRLAQDGVLGSTRGKGGGFRLAIPPDDLPLLRVIAPFDEMSGTRRCLLGRPQCSDLSPCPAHHHWRAVSDQVTAFFRDRTVGDLLREPRAAAHEGRAARSAPAANTGPTTREARMSPPGRRKQGSGRAEVGPATDSGEARRGASGGGQ